MQTPKATTVLILIGGLLVLLSGGLAILGVPTGFTFSDGHLMIQPLQGVSIYHGILEAISGVILIAMALYINSMNVMKAQNGTITALVFSVVSLIGGGGFFIGFVLASLGSVLGIINGYTAPGRNTYSQPLRETRSNKHATNISLPKNLSLLKSEEKRLYELVEEAGGAIFQADLVEKSGFSKVKVTRLLDRLEGLGIIERKRRGMTNMVILRRDASTS